jgi:hypothetical protein
MPDLRATSLEARIGWNGYFLPLFQPSMIVTQSGPVIQKRANYASSNIA